MISVHIIDQDSFKLNINDQKVELTYEEVNELQQKLNDYIKVYNKSKGIKICDECGQIFNDTNFSTCRKCIQEHIDRESYKNQMEKIWEDQRYNHWKLL